MKELIDKIVENTKEIKQLIDTLYQTYGVEFCDGFRTEGSSGDLYFQVFRGIDELAESLGVTTRDVVDQREFNYESIKFLQLADFKRAKIPERRMNNDSKTVDE